jgi:hypothetical protein
MGLDRKSKAAPEEVVSALAAKAPANNRAPLPKRDVDHASYCDCFGFSSLFERFHASARSADERLQIMPRIPAGVPEESHARRMQQRIQHLHEVL